MPDLDQLLTDFKKGDRLALSRLLSLLARGQAVREILAALPKTCSAKIVAITGSAGVGKSTLIGKLIAPIRADGKKVAVLACDPQSPLSGGALLGDRFRMSGQAKDEGVFIRSLPALSGHGAVADHLRAMTRLLAAFGFDIILIETVGAGQGDVTVSELANVVVLLLQPETGDDLQWEKAGVLEVADIIAVQKADMPRAEQVAAQVRAALELSDVRKIPVLLVSAKTGQNVAALWQAIWDCRSGRRAVDSYDEMLKIVRDVLSERFDAARRNGELRRLMEEWQRDRISEDELAERVLDIVSHAGR